MSPWVVRANTRGTITSASSVGLAPRRPSLNQSGLVVRSKRLCRLATSILWQVVLVARGYKESPALLLVRFFIFYDILLLKIAHLLCPPIPKIMNSDILYFSLSALINTVTGFGLGLYVLLISFRRPAARNLFYFCLSITIWSFFYFLWQTSSNHEVALFWSRLLMVGAILIPIAFFHFVLTYLNLHKNNFHKITLFIFYFFSLLWLCLLFTPYFVADVVPRSYFKYWPEAGPFFTPFLAFFVSLFIYSFFLLFKNFKTTKGDMHTHTALLLLGVTIGLLGGSTNYLLWYNINIAPWGNVLVSFFIFLTVYSIVKYKFMDLKVVSAELFTVLFLIVFSAEIFFSKSITEMALRIVMALFMALFGSILIRSVRKEVAQREQLAQANLHLQALNKQKSEFLDIASHQLRTPLSALIGLLSMQYDGDFDSLSKAEFKQQQKDMLTSAERLKNIVHDLMDAMEVELGAKLKPEPTDIAKLAEEAINILRPNYEKKSLYLKYSPPDRSLPLVSADPSFLAHVFINLVDNACNYTETGGAEIKLFQEKNQVIFQITDTGIGVTPTEKENLFGKFIRAKRAMLVRPDGSGLGLFIVKKIVEAHGGEVKIMSDGENKGSTFKIYLPVKP